LNEVFQLWINSLNGANSWNLPLIILLTFINWAIEAKKWQILLQTIEKTNFWHAYKAILTGQALAIASPNNIGEFAGRMMYTQEGNRGRSLILNIIAGLSQLCITFFAGVIAVAYLWQQLPHAFHVLAEILPVSLSYFNILILASTLIMLIIYYRLSQLTQYFIQLPIFKKYSYYFENITHLHWHKLTTVLTYSGFRFVIFLMQYVLMLQLCGVHAPIFQLAAITALFFLVLAIIPTIAIAEVGIRGVISLQLFGMISNNMIGILLAATAIWLMNRVIPAIVGALFVLNIKLFKSRPNEKVRQ
jgi:hypothetical protein